MTIYIVSGLPRSGTSMMMLMLKEGGIELFYDKDIPPNEANPNGFFETRKKKEEMDEEFMQSLEGKCIKIVSGALKVLPKNCNYKILTMKRNREEVIASRIKELKRKNNPAANEPSGWFYYKYKIEEEAGNKAIKENNWNNLVVNYNNMMENPILEIEKIIEFLNITLDKEKMLKVVDYSLYRNRL